MELESRARTGRKSARGRLSAAGHARGLGRMLTVLPILTAMTANAMFRIVLATKYGTREYAQRVIPGLVLATLAAWIGAWLAGSLTGPVRFAGIGA